MSRAALSVFVHGLYVAALVVTFFTVPDFALGLFGLPPHKDVFLYVAAMLLAFLGGYYILAARTEARGFFLFSVPQRYTVPLFFGAFVLLNLTKINIMLLTIPDVLLATWTLFALRADTRAASGVASPPSAATA
jgi:hypothetical protein